MGIARDDAEARTVAAVPIIGFVAPPMDAPTLSGEPIAAAQVDLTARFLSNGQPHRALPLTASLCTAVAREHRRDAGGRGIGTGRRGAGADRDALGHPDRGRRGRAGRRRPMGGAQRRVLSHGAAAVRRPHLRPALRLCTVNLTDWCRTLPTTCSPPGPGCNQCKPISVNFSLISKADTPSVAFPAALCPPTTRGTKASTSRYRTFVSHHGAARLRLTWVESCQAACGGAELKSDVRLGGPGVAGLSQR